MGSDVPSFRHIAAFSSFSCIKFLMRKCRYSDGANQNAGVFSAFCVLLPTSQENELRLADIARPARLV